MADHGAGFRRTDFAVAVTYQISELGAVGGNGNIVCLQLRVSVLAC